MQYFDFNAKSWKPLTSLAPAPVIASVFCAETVGSKIFISIKDDYNCYTVYCYDLEKNRWEKHSHSNGELSHLCTVGDYIYAFNSDVLRFHRGIAFLNNSGKVLQK